MPENTIQNYINKIDVLEKKVDEGKDQLLKFIDLEQFLDSPQEYLKNLAMDFYEENEGILREAIDLGEKKAKKLVGIYGKNNEKRNLQIK